MDIGYEDVGDGIRGLERRLAKPGDQEDTVRLSRRARPRELGFQRSEDVVVRQHANLTCPYGRLRVLAWKLA
jgi:hypothetical protein